MSGLLLKAFRWTFLDRQPNTNVVVHPQIASRTLWSSGTLIPIVMTVAILCELVLPGTWYFEFGRLYPFCLFLRLALISAVILGTSINYWRKPEAGWRRNMDIFCVAFGFVFFGIFLSQDYQTITFHFVY